ncbi:MAG: hypothetical protein H7Z41_15915 [Cytophagales bacterium]|nr:hypothetical protein [Armatimonadota bacterium]
MTEHEQQQEKDLSDDAAAATYEFRWDVEIPVGERRYGQKFMKQWKRVLQAQKMGPLVSAKLSPHGVRFQLCVTGEAESQQIVEREAEVAEELAHLRWTNDYPPEQCIAGEPAGRHPAGWQGVRVWMTFSRQDVETALSKKPRI